MPPRTFTITDLEASFELSLRAANKSPNTIRSYLEAARLLADYLARQGVPLALAQIEPRHVQGFITEQLERLTPHTASNRFKSLQQFFRWCVEEEELAVSPMEKLRPPKLTPKRRLPVTDENARRLLMACEGKMLEDRRDLALIRLLLDTPMRRSELANITLRDLRLPQREVDIVAKGRIERTCPFGVKAAQALDRYLRARQQHPQAALPWLWLGRKGRVTDSGVYQFLEVRARQAGIDQHISPHLFRRTFSHDWLAEGGDRGDLKRLGGWKSDAMVTLYTDDLADERARDAYRRRLTHGDRL